MSTKVCGVTAEFNPFHDGHAYLLREARRVTGADHVMVLMSPDFVQRGGPAIDDKYTRAEAALNAGADCVLEFPLRCATGAARTFAAAAISIFSLTGITNSICFGSEAGDIEPLKELASILCDETPEFREELRAGLRAGLSYPSAVEKALRGCSTDGSVLADAYSGPNSRLGVEYLVALRDHPGITPFTVPLVPGIHASDLRAKRIAEGERGLTADDLSAVLFDRLVLADRVSDIEALCEYADVNEDLAARILQKKDLYPTFEALASAVKTKAYTRTRIDRALTHILLGITSGGQTTFPYLRVLGFRRSFEPALALLAKNYPGTLIIRTADSKRLDASASAMYRQDRYASELWRGLRMIKYPDETRKPERSAGVIVIDG